MCLHTCNYVYSEFLLRYIHFYMLFEPGLAHSSWKRAKSIDWKENITIDRDQVPPRFKYCCKIQMSPAYYYNNLLLLERVFYGDKYARRDVFQSKRPLSVSRRAISCGESCQRTAITVSESERASPPMLSDSVLRDHVLQKRWESREEGGLINYLKQKNIYL